MGFRPFHSPIKGFPRNWIGPIKMDRNVQTIRWIDSCHVNIALIPVFRVFRLSGKKGNCPSIWADSGKSWRKWDEELMILWNFSMIRFGFHLGETGYCDLIPVYSITFSFGNHDFNEIMKWKKKNEQFEHFSNLMKWWNVFSLLLLI